MDEPLELWKKMRQRARTDLHWLCVNVLGYVDVGTVHLPLIRALQHFQGGTEKGEKVTMKDGAQYVPHVPLWKLESPQSKERKTMFLFPRGHLKSTVITIAHTIQWVINYPDIRVKLVSATDDQVKGFLRETKAHFQYNEHFRWLFPEFCPMAKKVQEFGNQDEFTVPCRKVHRKEPTVSTTTFGSVIASTHHEVVKVDDLVDLNNTKTAEQIAAVKMFFANLEPLVEKQENVPYPGRGWVDLTGTIYHFDDLHYSTVRAEEEKPLEKRQWAIVKKSAAPNYPEGPVLWPGRCSLQHLYSIEQDPAQGPEILYAQYLLNPKPAKSGIVESEDEIQWVPREVLKRLYAGLRKNVTVDLAGMDPTAKSSDNDYTVINLHGFAKDGTLFVIHLFRARYTPNEVINILFQIYKDHPRIGAVKIEKEAHARVLKPFLEAEQIRRQAFPPFQYIQRDNRTSKEQRIRSLQPMFRMQKIRFAEDLPCKRAIVDEIMFFPKYSHDDILDTCADAFSGRDGEITSDAHPIITPSVQLGQNPVPVFKGFGAEGKEIWAHPLMGYEEKEDDFHDPLTGWL